MPNQYTTGQNTALRPCGTDAAYSRHRARGEEVCDPCRRARVAASIESRRRKKEAALRKEQARQSALEALAHRFPDEYRALYARALTEITAC